MLKFQLRSSSLLHLPLQFANAGCDAKFQNIARFIQRYISPFDLFQLVIEVRAELAQLPPLQWRGSQRVRLLVCNRTRDRGQNLDRSGNSALQRCREEVDKQQTSHGEDHCQLFEPLKPLLQVGEIRFEVERADNSWAKKHRRSKRQAILCPEHSLGSTLGQQKLALQIGPDIGRKVSSIGQVKCSGADLWPGAERLQEFCPGERIIEFQGGGGIHREQVRGRTKLFDLLLARHVHVVGQETDASKDHAYAARNHGQQQQTLTKRKFADDGDGHASWSQLCA